MNIKTLDYEISLSKSDVEQIRAALRVWGKDEDIASNFNAADVHKYIEAWRNFVETDWDSWDISEYFHDVGCRYWLQIFIENTQPETKRMIENAVKPSDDKFRNKMNSVKNTDNKLHGKPFKEDSYFWETHTIYEER